MLEEISHTKPLPISKASCGCTCPLSRALERKTKLSKNTTSAFQAQEVRAIAQAVLARQHSSPGRTQIRRCSRLT